MSIMNRPSDGLYNILIAFIRCLVQNGKMPRDKLLALCAPVSAIDEQTLASSTLNRWVELGLLEDNDGELQICKTYAARVRKQSLSNAAIVSVLREIVLQERNNENFWDAENNRSADFTRAASWMLAQDVYTVEVTGHREAEDIESSQLPKDRAAFTNDTRWSGFKSWGSFLGIGYTSRYPRSGAFIIDPTAIIRDPVESILKGKKRIAVRPFVQQLAELVPIIDGGEYRLKVESQLDATAWQPPRETALSTSLSRALLRLHDARVLQLEDKSDAENLGLLGRDKTDLRRVSHIARKVGGK